MSAPEPEPALEEGRLAFTRDGHVVVVPLSDPASYSIFPIADANHALPGVDWSPDGTRLAVVGKFGGSSASAELHVYRPDGSLIRRVDLLGPGQTDIASTHMAVSWAPNGRDLAIVGTGWAGPVVLSVAGTLTDVTATAPQLSHRFDLYMDADAWDAESRIVSGYVEGSGAGLGDPFFFDTKGEALAPPPGWDSATHGMTRFLAWSSRGHLLKIEGPAGLARVLADGAWTNLDVGGPMGCAAWSPDGSELVYRFDRATLLRRKVVDESGVVADGAVTEVVLPPELSPRLSCPSWGRAPDATP